MGSPDRDGAFEIIASKVFGTKQGDPDHDGHPNQRILFGMERGPTYDEEGHQTGTAVGPFIRRADANTGEMLEDYVSVDGDKRMWSAIRQNAENIRLEAGQREQADADLRDDLEGEIADSYQEAIAYVDVTAEGIELSARRIAHTNTEPNLSPFFGHPQDDIVSQDNPGGYWRRFSVSTSAVVTTWDEVPDFGLGDAWAHIVASNTTNSAQYAYFYVDAQALKLKPSTDYTFLVEVSNATVSGDVYFQCPTRHGGGSANEDDFEESKTVNLETTQSSSHYVSARTKATFDAQQAVRGQIAVANGASIDAYVRLSLYASTVYEEDGETKVEPYSGAYKPYTPLHSSVVENSAQIKVNADSISQEVADRIAADGQVLSDANGYTDVRATQVQAGVVESVDASTWPNLGPWLAWPVEDVRTAGNPGGYWREATSADITESGKFDGWGLVHRDNSDGSSNAFTAIAPAYPPTGATVEPDTEYTIMVEFGQVSVTGTVEFQIDTAATSAFASKKWDTGGTGTLPITAAAAGTVHTALVKTKADLSSVTQLRCGVATSSGAVAQAVNLRISMYKGDRRSVVYDGNGNPTYAPLPFTPYSPLGETLENRAQITITKDAIESEVVARKTADNPNLSPFFGWPLEDVYNSTSNPTGYWFDNYSSSYVELSDGWGHVSRSNTGTSTLYSNIYESAAWRRANGDLKASTAYTVLIEIRNLTMVGECKANGITQHATSQPSMFQSSTAQQTMRDGELRFVGTTLADTSSALTSTRSLIQVPAGASFECDIRISLYEGDYDGPYKPYVPSSRTVEEQRTAILQTKESITSLAEGNNTYVSPDGQTVTSGMGSKIEQTQEAITAEVSNRKASLAPNLAPFYSSLERDGYWYYWPSTPGKPEQLGDGWAHVVMNNASGTSTMYSTVDVVDIPFDLDRSARPTMLVEVRNVVTDATDAELWFNPGGGNRTVSGQTWVPLLHDGSTVNAFGTGKVIRIPLMYSSDAGVNCLCNWWFALSEGKTAEFDARISLYNGIVEGGTEFLYDGPYKPYADHSATEENSSRITQTAEKIEHEVSTRIAQDPNMLLDWDAVDDNGSPTMSAVDADANRFWSDSDNTQVTPSLFLVGDPPRQGVRTASRYVCDGTYDGVRRRQLAFYSGDSLANLPYMAGYDYTFTCWARRTAGDSASCKVELRAVGSLTSTTPTTSVAILKTWEVGGSWTWCTCTFNLKAGGSVANRLYIGGVFAANSAGTIEVCMPRLVAGSAPESVEAEMSTKITQTNSSITSLAQMGEYYIDPETGQQVANTAKTYVDQTAEEWSAAAVKDLDVGGSNLLDGDASKPYMWTVNAPSAANFVKAESGTALNGEKWGVSWSFDSVSGYEKMYSPAIPVEAGKTYTVSAIATVGKAYSLVPMADEYEGYGISVRTSTASARDDASNAGFIAKAKFPESVSGKVKVEATFTVPSDVDSVYLVLNGGQLADSQSGLSFSLDKVKLERGSKATDWSIPLGESATLKVASDMVKAGVDSIQIGGANLLLSEPKQYTPTQYLGARLNLAENLVKGSTYTMQVWGTLTHSTKTPVINVYWGGGSVSLGKMEDKGNGYWLLTFTAPNSSSADTNNAWVCLYNTTPSVSGATYGWDLQKWKLERGNKPTDWSEADADLNAWISENHSAIEVNRSSIAAEVSTRRSAVQPNLAPWFEQPTADLYNATSNPEGYWYSISSPVFTRLDNGWAHYEADYSEATSTGYRQCTPVSETKFEEGKEYTLLVEIRNASVTGNVYFRCPDSGQFLRSDGTSGPRDFKIANGASEDRYKSTFRAKTASTKFGCCIRNDAGSTASFDVRVSIYEGDYTGYRIDENGNRVADNPPYKPYNPAALQLYEARTDIIQTASDVETIIENQTAYERELELLSGNVELDYEIDTLGVKWNYSTFGGTSNPGEAYLCKCEKYTKDAEGRYSLNPSPWSDADSKVEFYGTMRTVPKGMVNPGTVAPYNTTVYIVLRLASAASTTGTVYMVWFDANSNKWQYSAKDPSAIGGDWTWSDATDAILASFIETGSEEPLVSCVQYRPVLTSQQLTTGNNAYQKAESAYSNALAAAKDFTMAVSGTCSEAIGTAAKTVPIPNFELYRGVAVNVTFTNGNTANTPTLNVAGTGAKAVYVGGAAASTTNPCRFSAGSILTFVYNGTAWELQDSPAQVWPATDGGVAAGTAAKTATVGSTAFVARQGVAVRWSPTNTNTAATPTLNVNGTGAWQVWANGAAVTAGAYQLTAGVEYTLALTNVNGTMRWVMDTALLAANAAQDSANEANNKVTAVYGTCSTAAGTAAKVVDCTNFILYTGQRIAIKFTTANTKKGAITLNVNSTGAKPVQANLAATSTTNPIYWKADATLTFVYNGTNWVLETNVSGPFVASCATAAGTATKTASVSDDGFAIVNGTTVSVKFDATNSVAAPKLNLNSTGAFPIQAEDVNLTANDPYAWFAGDSVTMVFDNGIWEMDMAQAIARMSLKVFTCIRDYSDGTLVCKTNQLVGALVNANASFDVTPVSWDATLDNYDDETKAKFKRLGGKVPSAVPSTPYSRVNSSGAYWYDTTGVADANVTSKITKDGVVQLGKTNGTHTLINSVSYGIYPANYPSGSYPSTAAAANTSDSLMSISATPAVRIGKYSGPHIYMTATDFMLRDSTSGSLVTFLQYGRTTSTGNTTKTEYFYGKTTYAYVLSYAVKSVTSVKFKWISFTSPAWPEPDIFELEVPQSTTNGWSLSGKTISLNGGMQQTWTEFAQQNDGITKVEVVYVTNASPSTIMYVGSMADPISTLRVRGTQYGQIQFQVGSDSAGNGYTASAIRAYAATNTSGLNLVVQSGGNIIVGSGEAPGNLYNAGVGADGSERTFIVSDNQVYIMTNANTIANRRVHTFDTDGSFEVSGQVRADSMAVKDGATFKSVSLEGHTHDYLPLTGGTLSGGLTVETSSNPAAVVLKSKQVNLKNSKNGLSSGTIYPCTSLTDNNNLTIGKFECSVNSNGTIGVSLYSRNYDSSGAQLAQNTLTLTVNKSGVRGVSVSEAAPWRSALGLGSLATKSSVSKSDLASGFVLPIANGGTNATTADEACGNLGLLYELGSTISSITWHGSGYVTSATHDCYFCIPLGVRVSSGVNKVQLSGGSITIRHGGGYHYGSTATNGLTFNANGTTSGTATYTATPNRLGMVNVKLSTTADQASAINNNSVGIAIVGVTVTFAHT